MEEKMYEILTDTLETKINDLGKRKEEYEKELNELGGAILATSERENLIKDLEKINAELEEAKLDEKRVSELRNEIIESKEKKDGLLKDLENLKKAKNDYEIVLYDEKNKRDYEDGKYKKGNEEKKLADDLVKINNEIITKIASLKPLLALETEMNDFYKKYKVKDKYLKIQKSTEQHQEHEAENNSAHQEQSNGTVTTEEIEPNSEIMDFEKIKKEAVDGEYKEVKQPTQGQQKVEQQSVQQPTQGQQKATQQSEQQAKQEQQKPTQQSEQQEQQEVNPVPLFEGIEINANTGNVNVIFEDEKNNKEIPIRELLASKNEIYKRLNIKADIAKYCKTEKLGFLTKMKILRNIDPIVVSIIDYYGGDDDLLFYYDCIAYGKELPFNLDYNLTNSKLDNISFNIVNDIAKKAKELNGVEVEGVKDNIIKRIIKGIKSGNLLEAFKKPKQIAAQGIDKAKNVKDNVADMAKSAKDTVANKTADSMVKIADRIRVDGHADEVAKRHTEQQNHQSENSKQRNASEQEK